MIPITSHIENLLLKAVVDGASNLDALIRSYRTLAGRATLTKLDVAGETAIVARTLVSRGLLEQSGETLSVTAAGTQALRDVQSFYSSVFRSLDA